VYSSLIEDESGIRAWTTRKLVVENIELLEVGAGLWKPCVWNNLFIRDV
jgi:hypothetical protein